MIKYKDLKVGTRFYHDYIHEWNNDFGKFHKLENSIFIKADGYAYEYINGTVITVPDDQYVIVAG